MDVMEHKQARVLPTWQLAEAFGTSNKVITQNFRRNRDQYIEGTHFHELKGEELKDFKRLHQNDSTLKYASVYYLWTEQGVWLHAKSLNSEKAWVAHRLLVEAHFNQQQATQGGINLKPALTYDDIQPIIARLEVLEMSITLHSGEQKRLRNAIGERVYTLSKKEKCARPVLFRAIYSDIRERYGVESYRDVKQHQLQDALNFVAGWGGLRK